MQRSEMPRFCAEAKMSTFFRAAARSSARLRPSALTGGILPSTGSTTIDVRSVETPLSPFSTIQIELS